MKVTVLLKKYFSISLCVGIILLSSFFASIIQTSFGSVDIELKELKTSDGQTLIYDLYKPKLASSSNKVPFVVVVPGFQRSKEALSNIAIELSRRGFAIALIDPYAQGMSSSSTSRLAATTQGYGMFALVDYVYEGNFAFVDINKIGLSDFGNPEGYNSRQVHGWCKRYDNSKTDELKEMEIVMDWLKSNISQSKYVSLIHNDFKYDNLVLDENDLSIKAILDWEMCTIGDPFMDLGTSLAYWIQHNDPDFIKGVGLNITLDSNNPTRNKILNLYSEKFGNKIENIVFYFVFGLFKIAVIVQQIFFRYKNGFTKDARFKHLNLVVKAYSFLAIKSIEKQKIEQEKASERKSLVGTGDRSEKIRTYNFPQGRVTDHRLKLTLYNIENFLDGDIDEMLDSLKAQSNAEKLLEIQDE